MHRQLDDLIPTLLISLADVCRRQGIHRGVTMSQSRKEVSPRLKARIAGFLYIIIIAGALFIPFAVAPSGLMLGDAALPTVAKILAARQLYILSGVAQLIVAACDVGVALLLHELLKPVSKRLSFLAAFFRLVFAAIVIANLFNHFAPLVLLTGSVHLGAFNPDQLDALAQMFIRLRTTGLDIALVFFGIHCALVGFLLLRSTFFPRILGLLMMIGGAGYMANILACIIPYAVAARLFPYIMLPAGVAEILLTTWLIIVGVNVAKWRAAARTVERSNGFASAPDSK